jgi:hypothetical protein
LSVGTAAGSIAIGVLLAAAVSQAADLSAYRLTQCSAPSKDNLKLVEDGRSIRNLYHLSRRGWMNVTRFKNPHHIFEYGTSPDGRYLLVWHMDFSPRRMSVYDLHRGGARIARFEAEAGGSFCWNAQNHIVHVSGCGSSCEICKVYSREGRVLFWLGDRVMDVSPSGRYLATFPVAWVGHQEIAVYDLYETIDGSGLIATTPIWIVSSVGEVEKIDWLDEQSVVMHYVSADDLTGTDKKQMTLILQSREGRR